MYDNQVTKGGICWFEMELERTDDGLKFWVKADPRIESLMKGLGTGKTDILQAFGRAWVSMDGKDIEVYNQKDELPPYALSQPCTPLKVSPARGVNIINLSFLRFAGISDPQGLRFCVLGPFSKQYVNEISELIVTETRKLIRDFIVPVHINLRISSQES